MVLPSLLGKLGYAGDPGSIPGSGTSLGEGNDNPVDPGSKCDQLLDTKADAHVPETAHPRGPRLT